MAAGATFKGIVKVTYYVVNYNFECLGVIRNQFLPHDNPPVSTLVGVASVKFPRVALDFGITTLTWSALYFGVKYFGKFRKSNVNAHFKRRRLRIKPTGSFAISTESAFSF